MEHERRFFTLDALKIEQREDGKTPTIRGHAAVFERLSDNLGGFREKIAPGAFDGVLGDDVRALFNHNTDLVLGRTKSGTLRLSVDSSGLVYEIDPPDTQAARDLIASMQRGDIDQSRFAFSVDEDDWQEDDEGRVIRTILKFRRLYDVSPVTFPAYPDAKVGLRSLRTWQAERSHYRNDLLKRRLDLAALEC